MGELIKHIQFIIVGLFFSFCANSQGLTNDEHHKLDSLIDRYFEYSDYEHSSPEIAFGYEPSYLFFLILHLDSAGKVNKVQLMSDHGYKDSIYAIFSRLNPEVFKTWKSTGNGNKTIIIPLAYASQHGDPTYVRDVAENAIMPGVFNNTIVLTKQVFGWGRWHKFSESLEKRKRE